MFIIRELLYGSLACILHVLCCFCAKKFHYNVVLVMYLVARKLKLTYIHFNSDFTYSLYVDYVVYVAVT